MRESREGFTDVGTEASCGAAVDRTAIAPLPYTVPGATGESQQWEKATPDETKVDPLSGAEEKDPAAPLKTVPEGQSADATTAVIPGTGRGMRGLDGKETGRKMERPD